MPKAHSKFKYVEITTDGRTVWVNTELGCAARYSSSMAESFRLRNSDLCYRGKNPGDWAWWVAAVFEMHRIKVSKQYRPSLPAVARLAKDATGKERNWLPVELHNLYMRGWRDGAGTVSMRHSHSDVPEYADGYKAGVDARIHAYNKAAKRLKYLTNVLRTAKEPQ